MTTLLDVVLLAFPLGELSLASLFLTEDVAAREVFSERVLRLVLSVGCFMHSLCWVVLRCIL